MRHTLWGILFLVLAPTASAQRTTPRTTTTRATPEAIRVQTSRPVLFETALTAERGRLIRDARLAERSTEARTLIPGLVSAFNERMGSREHTSVSVMEVALAVLHAHERLAGHSQEEIDLLVFDLYLEVASGDLATVGEDSQLANVDLQNALQRQQQALQTMANVSKLLHDTAQAVIRKIGG